MKPIFTPITLVLTFFMAILAVARGATPSSRKEGTAAYLSAGKKIRVDTYLPTGTQRHPAVIVLYGSGGSIVGKGEVVDFARQLADSGAAVFLVHYFKRTNTLFVTKDSTIHQHQAVWTDTVQDAVDFVVAHPQVRQESVGIFGYSLGAYLAVAEGSRDPRVDAVVALSGGIFAENRGKQKRFPPVLILHGKQDERVLVKWGADIQQTWKRHGGRAEMHIYEDEGHRLSKGALSDARERTVRFLTQHLHLPLP